MTSQGVPVVAEVLEQPRAPKIVRGNHRFGDLLLRILAGLVLLYLFLPIFVIVLFSFNDPKGKFNYSWQGFTLKNWADPFKYPPLTDALKLSLNVAAVSTLVALVLGFMIWASWPSDATWVVGTLVGINFLVSGISRLMISIHGHSKPAE